MSVTTGLSPLLMNMLLDRLSCRRERKILVGRFTRTVRAIEVNGRYLLRCLAQRCSVRLRESFVHARLSSRSEPIPARASDGLGKISRAILSRSSFESINAGTVNILAA